MEFKSKYVIVKMKEVRIKKGYSYRQLGAILGVSASNIQKLEAFKVKFVDLSYIFTFCEKMQIPISSLLPPEDLEMSDIESVVDRLNTEVLSCPKASTILEIILTDRKNSNAVE